MERRETNDDVFKIDELPVQFARILRLVLRKGLEENAFDFLDSIEISTEKWNSLCRPIPPLITEDELRILREKFEFSPQAIAHIDEIGNLIRTNPEYKANIQLPKVSEKLNRLIVIMRCAMLTPGVNKETLLSNDISPDRLEQLRHQPYCPPTLEEIGEIEDLYGDDLCELKPDFFDKLRNSIKFYSFDKVSDEENDRPVSEIDDMRQYYRLLYSDLMIKIAPNFEGAVPDKFWDKKVKSHIDMLKDATREDLKKAIIIAKEDKGKNAVSLLKIFFDKDTSFLMRFEIEYRFRGRSSLPVLVRYLKKQRAFKDLEFEYDPGEYGDDGWGNRTTHYESASLGFSSNKFPVVSADCMDNPELKETLDRHRKLLELSENNIDIKMQVLMNVLAGQFYGVHMGHLSELLSLSKDDIVRLIDKINDDCKDDDCRIIVRNSIAIVAPVDESKDVVIPDNNDTRYIFLCQQSILKFIKEDLKH